MCVSKAQWGGIIHTNMIHTFILGKYNKIRTWIYCNLRLRITIKISNYKDFKY